MRRMSRRSRNLLLILTVVVALVLGLAQLRNRREAEMEKASFVTIPGTEVSRNLVSFLTRTGLDAGTIKCDEKAECLNSEPATVPETSWKILGLMSRYTTDRDADYLEMSLDLREKWNSLLKGHAEWWNALPFYYAYRASGDKRFLRTFLFATINGVSALESIYSDERLNKTGLMLTIQLMRALIVAGPYLSEERLLVETFEKEDVARDFMAHRKKFFATAQRLRELSRQKHATGSLSESVLSDNSEGFRRDSCWYYLGSMSWHRAYGDKAALDEVLAFVKLANFKDRPAGEFRYEMQQRILPCAELLKELSETGHPTKEDFHALVEKLILPWFDSDIRPICGGHNALLARAYKGQGFTVRESSCFRNVESIADASWLAFLLANDTKPYRLEKRG